ncbi:MAG TPA: TonB family protein [Gemmatimonadaceae bacterium]
MLGVLLESRARPQRRFGGMALSIATHVAIIGAVTATAVHATRPVRDPIVSVHITPPANPTPPARAEHRPRTNAASARETPNIVVPQIHVPTVIPTSIVVTDPLPRVMPDYDANLPGTRTGSVTGARSVVDGDGAPDESEWRGSDLLMRIVTSGTPRYPESLRQAGVDGRVLVRFVVDTLGNIDMGSVQVLTSTHDLFARAVRDALGNFRFRPAEARGHRVQAMAEMPFEFQIRR